jgi:hypothetical protein
MNRILLLLVLFATTSFAQKQPKNKVFVSKSGIIEIQSGTKKANLLSFTKNPTVVEYTSLYRKVFLNDMVDSIKIKLKENKTTYVSVVFDQDTTTIALNYVPDYKRNYLEILRKANVYSGQYSEKMPQIEYQNTTDINLQALRKEFNLDSVAGNGDEVSRILNLMYWLHNQTKHDGSKGGPEVRNASSIINACKNENRWVNCRMLAIALNDCYLAMGFKSRYITCMAKDLIYDDCHVINMVYSNDLKKWLYIDPTWAAYVMDENDNMLSVQEVREYLIKGLPLKTNSEANRNNSSPLDAKWYLQKYMAKNLYRIESPLISRYNHETQGNDTMKFVQLVPQDFYHPKIDRHQITRNKGVTVRYMMANPEKFWAIPE